MARMAIVLTEESWFKSSFCLGQNTVAVKINNILWKYFKCQNWIFSSVLVKWSNMHQYLNMSGAREQTRISYFLNTIDRTPYSERKRTK